MNRLAALTLLLALLLITIFIPLMLACKTKRFCFPGQFICVVV